MKLVPRALSLAGLCLTASLAAPACRAVPLPPIPKPPRPQPVVDDYFGTKVIDDDRWMEDEPEPRFKYMLTRQNAFARLILSRISGRDKILQDIAAVDGLAARVASVVPAGGKYFFIRRDAGSEIGKLYMRDAKGMEKLLVDPARFGSADAHAEIDQFAPSPDGTLVAYGISQGGSERSVLHVLETQSLKARPDVIDRAQFAGVSWLPDHSGFFYTRTAKLADTAPVTEHFAHMRVYLHHLGADPEKDVLALDADHLPFAFHAAQAFPAVALTAGSAYALAVVSDGVSPENTIAVAPLATVAGGHADWQMVATQQDGVVGATVRGGEIYLQTHLNAPRFKIVAEDLAKPGFAGAKTILPEQKTVVVGLAASADALYVAARAGGAMTLSRIAGDTAKPAAIKLPFVGGIAGLAADPQAPGAVFGLEGWVHPVAWLAYDPAAKKLMDTGMAPPVAHDFSGYDTVETTARAPDGTQIPLSIIMKHGTKPDSRHPALIDGYGAYGISIDPEFQPALFAWLDRGGIFAEAHVRGGGELGQPWHDAGKIATKHNTITDFIACAEELVKRGLTTHARMAGEGTSAGGITIGGAITKRPDLFTAALIRVGATNTLREELTEGGPANIPEFGSTKNKTQFPYMLQMDAYQQIKPGVNYPAVLLTGGFNDPRVTVWIPAKMTAKLQRDSATRRPVLFRVEFDAGHGLGSTRSQREAETADEYAFLLWQMQMPGYELK